MIKKEERKQLDITVRYSAEYRSIEIWNDKLENMLTILQAEEMTGKSTFF